MTKWPFFAGLVILCIVVLYGEKSVEVPFTAATANTVTMPTTSIQKKYVPPVVNAEPSPRLYIDTQPTFYGYVCTEDCSGHEAGYEWAEENGIEDPDDCGGNSDSFIEGCQSYAEEQLEENAYEQDEYEEEYTGYY